MLRNLGAYTIEFSSGDRTELSMPEPPPPGVSSNPVAAGDPPPARSYRVTPATGQVELLGSQSVLTLTLASQNLLAHARNLAAKQESEYHQFAVVFAHAACELHTEWAITRLMDGRSDKVLVELVLPAELDVMSLENQRIRRVYV